MIYIGSKRRKAGKIIPIMLDNDHSFAYASQQYD